MVAVDNLSDIPVWLSDSLCRAITGDGSIKRALYSDDDVSVIQFRRCVFANGLDVGALRGDLADRMALADLDRMGPGVRRAEEALAAEWSEALRAIAKDITMRDIAPVHPGRILADQYLTDLGE